MVALVKRMKFEKYFESGPKEFLNLVKNADYVVGRSFHLMVFCAIFHKKFIAIDGMGDSRISELLRKTGLALMPPKTRSVSGARPTHVCTFSMDIRASQASPS